MIETNVLREKVLDLAIRGKLVSQDPNDEPASVLLERIRAEKQQMVKDGKLKAKDIKNDTIIFKGEDNLHYEKFQDGTVKCIEDEIPFEIPSSWSWARLGAVSEAIGDGDHQPPPQTLTGVPFLVISNVSNGKLSFTETRFVSNEYYDSLPESRKPRNGDLLFTVTGSYGIPVLVDTDIQFCFQRHIAIIHPCIITNHYLYAVLGSTYIKSFCDAKATGVAQRTVSLTTLRDMLIPIAPLSEQANIFAQAEMLLQIIEEITFGQKDLLETIATTKTRILNLAIRGRLVPQDPADEPASVLLERIRSEKEELIKQGKIKRDKKESIIFKGDDNSYYEKIDENIIDITDEIPFDIPENWVWCRLNMLCKKEIQRGKAPKYSEKSSTLVFAQKCNTKKGVINISLAQYLDESILKKYPPEFFMQYNDIVINSTGTGTLGRVGIFEKSDDIYGLPIVPDSHITTIRVSELVVAKYIYALLKLKQPYLETVGEGSTNQKELRTETLSNILVPLPPVLEQKQIVDTINTINQRLNNMEQSLN